MEKHNVIRMAGGLVGGLAAAAALSVGLIVSAPHLDAAQDPQTQAGRPGPRRGGPGLMGPGGRGGPMGGGALMGMVRDLNDAQRQQVRAIHEKYAQQMQPIAERVRLAREAVHNAIVSGNTTNLQGLAIEVGNAETELTYLSAQVQAEIYNILTPEQKQTLAQRRQNMAQRRQEMLQKRQQRTQ